jgi:hypothetical protein
MPHTVAAARRDATTLTPEGRVVAPAATLSDILRLECAQLWGCSARHGLGLGGGETEADAQALVTVTGGG